MNKPTEGTPTPPSVGLVGGKERGGRGNRKHRQGVRQDGRGCGLNEEGKNLRNDNRVTTYSEVVRATFSTPYKRKPKRTDEARSRAKQDEPKPPRKPTETTRSQRDGRRSGSTRTGRGTIAEQSEKPRATATPPTLKKSFFFILQTG